MQHKINYVFTFIQKVYVSNSRKIDKNKNLSKDVRKKCIKWPTFFNLGILPKNTRLQSYGS